MYKLSNRSLGNLMMVDERLVTMCHRAIEVVNFAVICGHRDAKEQNDFYFRGMSKLEYPDSKHNKDPSQAIDAVPYPIDWEDQRRFYYLAGIFKAIAYDLGFQLRHGGDWDRDDIFKDQKFYDLPHFEIYE